MKELINIQFGFVWDEVIKVLPVSIIQELKDNVKSNNMFCSIEIDSQELYENIMQANKIVKGKSLIRLVRENIFISQEDIQDNKCYELHLEFLKSKELKLKQEPSSFYELQTECSNCGRYRWIQKEDLEIKGKMKNDIENVENGEVLISSNLKESLQREGIENIEYRSIKNLDAWQLGCVKPAVIMSIENQYLLEKNNCRKCGLPRILVYEDSNKINLFVPPFNSPRIEKTPALLLEKMEGDFAFTDLEFGTLGRLPEGSPALEASEFTYKSSWPKIVVTGKFLKVLFQAKVKGIKVTTAKIVQQLQTS